MAEVRIGDRPLKELVNMNWRETSGVDTPANLEAGWALMKNAGSGSDVDDLVDLLVEEELNGGEVDFSDAPSNVQAAARILGSYLEEDTVQKMNMGTHGGKKRGKFPMPSDGRRHVSVVMRKQEQAFVDAWESIPDFAADLAKAAVDRDETAIRQHLARLRHAVEERLAA